MKFKSIGFEVHHVTFGKHKGEICVTWLHYFFGFGMEIGRLYFEDSFSAIRHVQTHLHEELNWMR